MNIKITISTIFLLSILPVISISTAQDIIPEESNIPTIQRDVLPVYPFVQIYSDLYLNVMEKWTQIWWTQREITA